MASLTRDPNFLPRFHVVMKTDQELPPNFVVKLLMEVFYLSQQDAQDLAIPILSHRTTYYGNYTKEVAEYKVFELSQQVIRQGRQLDSHFETISFPNGIASARF